MFGCKFIIIIITAYLVETATTYLTDYSYSSMIVNEICFIIIIIISTYIN